MNASLYLVHMQKSAVTLEDMTLQTMVSVDTDRPEPDTLQDLTRHHHQHSELFACCSGEIWLDTTGGLLQLEAGDLLVVPPGVPHVCIAHRQTESFCVISFTGVKRPTPSTGQLYNRCAAFFTGENMHLLRGQPELCRKALEVTEAARRGAEHLPALRLAELLLCICELQPSPRSARPISLEDATESELSRSICLEYLVNNYFRRPVTTQQIADMLYISPRQLARIIQKQYGTTLHELMMQKRTATAEQLLRTTDLTVDEIAHTVGFGSRAGLYREFTRRYGVTPAQYRQALEE